MATTTAPNRPADPMHYDPAIYKTEAVCRIWYCGHLVDSEEAEYCGQCGYPRYE